MRTSRHGYEHRSPPPRMWREIGPGFRRGEHGGNGKHLAHDKTAVEVRAGDVTGVTPEEGLETMRPPPPAANPAATATRWQTSDKRRCPRTHNLGLARRAEGRENGCMPSSAG